MLLLRERSDLDQYCLYMFLKASKQATKQRTFHTTSYQLQIIGVRHKAEYCLRPVLGCKSCCIFHQLS